jgi:hypothetical protein
MDLTLDHSHLLCEVLVLRAQDEEIFYQKITNSNVQRKLHNIFQAFPVSCVLFAVLGEFIALNFLKYHPA